MAFQVWKAFWISTIFLKAKFTLDLTVPGVAKSGSLGDASCLRIVAGLGKEDLEMIGITWNQTIIIKEMVLETLTLYLFAGNVLQDEELVEGFADICVARCVILRLPLFASTVAFRKSTPVSRFAG